ncbi:MAG: AMP-binding protein [bacterium]|nr:AMP-binding protein [bacterium]
MTQNNEGNAGTLAAGQNIRERDYWLEKLSGQLTKIFFPYDYRKTDEEEKARLTFKISGDAYALLMKISNKSNPRLHILLVTGWLILLNKYTAGSDIVIGVPTYKQDVQGELINTVLALRANVTADMSVKEMLMQVGKLVVEADKNQNYPMETLAYKLDLTDSGEGFPLFDLSVLLETIHDKSYLDRIRQNMIVSFRLGENYLEGEIEYNPQLYRESTVQRIAGHYNQLLENVLSDVNRSVAEVDMVSPEEQRRVREEFNDNAADFHREKSIYTLIEEHAEKTPENMALSFEGQDISYKQLNSAANYVAAQLIKNGVKADDTVGVLMGRSPFMVTAILAVWKAGGAYIPLDVKYPAQRLTGILADSETSVLLAGPGVDIPQLKQVYDGTVIDVIPSLEAAREGKNHPNPNVDVSMNGLAYVIYTSGSTGKPKGAMVEHIGMMNHIQSKINLLGVTGKSIVAQNASHTFDISVWQFFVALAEGGKTVIYPDLLVLDALKFIDRVIADKLTILEVVPSYLNVVLDAVGSRCEAPAEAANKVPLPIDYLLVTGEEVKPHLVNR